MLPLCGFGKDPEIFGAGGVGENVESALTIGESAEFDGEEDVRGSSGDPSLLLIGLSSPSSENPSTYISTASSTLISSSLISGQ